MSKGNMFLSRASGKLGTIVFSVSHGKQLQRTLNESKPSRSRAQVLHRLDMFGPAKFWSHLPAGILEQAFEDQRPGETTFNCFMRHNVGKQGIWYSREDADQDAPCATTWNMSQGSLTAMHARPRIYDSASLYGWPVQAPVTGMTWGVLNQELAERYGYEEGDMITLLAQYYEGVTYSARKTHFNSCRTVNHVHQFTIDFSDPAVVPTSAADGELSVRRSNDWMLLWAPKHTFPTGNMQCIGYAVIRSRRANGKVLVCPSQLALNTTASACLEDYATEAAREQALQSYGYEEFPLVPRS